MRNMCKNEKYKCSESNKHSNYDFSHVVLHYK